MSRLFSHPVTFATITQLPRIGLPHRTCTTSLSRSMPPSRGRARGRARNSRTHRNVRRRNPAQSAVPPPDPFAGPSLLPSEPTSLPSNSVALVWLRNDLRVRDHPALHLANSADYVCPVYVFDQSKYGPRSSSPWGFSRTGPFRANFQRQAIKSLSLALRHRGSDILIRIGNPVENIIDVARELVKGLQLPVHVITCKETTWDETQDEKRMKEALDQLADDTGTEIHMHMVWGSTMHHPHDLPFNPAGPAVPQTFTAYRKWIESPGGPAVRDELPTPDEFKPFPLHLRIPSDKLPTLGIDLQVEGLADPLDYPFPSPLGVHEFEGGCDKAEQRVDEYFWRWKGLEEYKDTRNLSGRRNTSSKLSPWLAAGCISARSIYHQVRSFEQKNEATEHTYWMIFELMTRDYFRWISSSVGTRLFSLNGYTGPEGPEGPVWEIAPQLVTAQHRENFDKWKEGMTGAPFVDANMRELAFTGFMSNRGRQNVASFLIHDLGFPDWRAGAEYFESMLIDHDVASNWGNWAYLAGVGSDPRGGRKFNVIKQSYDYDGDAFFITRWCPELNNIPPELIHEPHRLTPDELELYDIKLGETYPKPIVKLPRAPVHKNK